MIIGLTSGKRIRVDTQIADATLEAWFDAGSSLPGLSDMGGVFRSLRGIAEEEDLSSVAIGACEGSSLDEAPCALCTFVQARDQTWELEESCP